jgi:membrane-associated protease RseP (regulator of RpoE activity)
MDSETGSDPQPPLRAAAGEPPQSVPPALPVLRDGAIPWHGGSEIASAFHEPQSNYVLAEVVEPIYYAPPRYRRRIWLPVLLFVLTCCSTFLAGASWGSATFSSRDGLVYMGAVMTILLAHEMGHFLQAVRYGIPASLPFFIPMPLTPIGTMGAVIGMQGSRADRRELFDIGISGPLAGLVVALPIAILGIAMAVPSAIHPGEEGVTFQNPLLFQAIIGYFHPHLQPNQALDWNPLYWAGWVGMLITGLNMLPISQLDGGHVSYALFGRRAHWLARAMVLAGVTFIVYTHEFGWTLMLALVMFIGTDHPPTANDHAPLGWQRRLIGALSLVIPVLCFVPIPVK